MRQHLMRLTTELRWEPVRTRVRAWVGDDALATEGNYNNDIGVPLTLLRLRSTHRLAVVELGMNHPGEIAQLAAMAQPTVALVNNAQREHLEFMGSVDEVAADLGRAADIFGEAGVRHRIGQHRTGLADQTHRPVCDQHRADQPHQRIEPDRAIGASDQQRDQDGDDDLNQLH